MKESEQAWHRPCDSTTLVTSNNDDNNNNKPGGDLSGPSLNFGPSDPPSAPQPEAPTSAEAPSAPEGDGGTQQLDLGEQPNYEPTRGAKGPGLGEKLTGFIEVARDHTRELVNKFAAKKRPKSQEEGQTGATQFLPTQEFTFSQTLSKAKGGIRNLSSKLKSAPGSFDPATLAHWVTGLSSSVQSRGLSFYLKSATVLTCAFVYADLAALYLSKFIPEPPPARGARIGMASRKTVALEDFAPITGRNLFSSKGLMPGEDAPTNTDPGGAPVKTTLPFTLVGTIILRDELRSIGTIEDKANQMVYPVRVDDEIPQKAKILRVEARKVIFLNTAANRREYVELPEENSAVNPRITLGTSTASGGGQGIEQLSANQFFVNRSEVDRALADLNNILTQARAVPNFENGLPAGYKLFQIVPGSIYDKLGLRNGDVIAGMDGQPVNDPGKAFEALGRLKETNHLELTIKRDGKSTNMTYDIR